MKLKKIKLPLEAKDDRVNARRWYLARVDGSWFAGKFTREWYGWNFCGVQDITCGFQYDDPSWQELYEMRSR